MGLSGGSAVKNPPANVGAASSTLGSGRSPREGNGNPLQYSCLENLIDGGTWWVTIHLVTKSRTRLSDFTFTFHFLQSFTQSPDLFFSTASIFYFVWVLAQLVMSNSL